MKIRLDVEVRNVAARHAVVEVPEQVGYAICARGMATQLPPYTSVTAELNAAQVAALTRR